MPCCLLLQNLLRMLKIKITDCDNHLNETFSMEKVNEWDGISITRVKHITCFSRYVQQGLYVDLIDLRRQVWIALWKVRKISMIIWLNNLKSKNMKNKCLHFLLVAEKVVECEWYLILKLMLIQCYIKPNNTWI